MWLIPVFALLFVLFTHFFQLFHFAADKYVKLSNAAFSTVGQVNLSSSTGYTADAAGLTYRGETLMGNGGSCLGSAHCDGSGQWYNMVANDRQYVFESNPELKEIGVYLDLTPNPY